MMHHDERQVARRCAARQHPRTPTVQAVTSRARRIAHHPLPEG
ncbi:hypothetical protein [Streptomyces sp. H021]|nr:hypothetical protein [Streptomyces sp. H021]